MLDKLNLYSLDFIGKLGSVKFVYYLVHGNSKIMGEGFPLECLPLFGLNIAVFGFWRVQRNYTTTAPAYMHTSYNSSPLISDVIVVLTYKPPIWERVNSVGVLLALNSSGTRILLRNKP